MAYPEILARSRCKRKAKTTVQKQNFSSEHLTLIRQKADEIKT